LTIVAVDTKSRRIMIDGVWASCNIGRTGAIAAAEKREGDGATPLGDWPIRGALLRADRGLMPPTGLPWRWLRREDGWSDDPDDAAYNRPVRYPHPFSAERLWRDDALYDAIVWLGHNDGPPIRRLGSAIFLHLASQEGHHTEGCVAVSRESMQLLLRMMTTSSILEVG
jgi:L,D-peptidoglycan transpeptidase YkuD (ErfK/YbiS/YcfS/YnhG family)